MSNNHLTEEQREFYEDLSSKFNDTIKKIEMVCLEGQKELFDALHITLPVGKKSLWAILAYGEKDLHLYINPNEPTILGFKIGNQKKAPKEQMFSFSNISSWKVEPVFKNLLLWKTIDTYSLALHVCLNSEVVDEVQGTFIVQTQMKASDTLKMMLSYKA